MLSMPGRYVGLVLLPMAVAAGSAAGAVDLNGSFFGGPPGAVVQLRNANGACQEDRFPAARVTFTPDGRVKAAAK